MLLTESTKQKQEIEKSFRILLLYMNPSKLDSEDQDCILDLDSETHQYYYKKKNKWKIKHNNVYYKTLPHLFDSLNEYQTVFETFLRLEIKARIQKERKLPSHQIIKSKFTQKQTLLNEQMLEFASA